MWFEKVTLTHIAGCGALPVIIAQNKCDLPMHADVPGHDAMIQWAAANGKLSEGACAWCWRVVCLVLAWYTSGSGTVTFTQGS